jgi:hypothetical protein
MFWMFDWAINTKPKTKTEGNLGEALHSNQKLYPVTMLYPVTIMSISDKLEKSRLVCNHVSFAQRSLITVALDTDWSHTI